MAKLMLVDPEKCQGCRIGEMVCSAQHEKVVNPYRSRVKVIKWDLCDGDPICVRFCPYEALQYVEEAELSTPKRRGSAEKLRAIMRQAIGPVNTTS